MIQSGKSVLRSLPAALAVFGFAFLAGCAAVSSETASGKVNAADKAVSIAREGNTTADASAELKMAQDKLVAAKAAQTNQYYSEASRLADEAAADADYARAKATTARTQRMVTDLQQSISMLRKEIQSSPQP